MPWTPLRALGQEIPENFPILAGELGQSEHIFQVPPGGAQADLHHQRHRGLQPQLRKVTKAKSVFSTDDSLLKMLYLAMMDITKKWTGRRQDWSLIHAQLSIYFAGRMPE